MASFDCLLELETTLVRIRSQAIKNGNVVATAYLDELGFVFEAVEQLLSCFTED